MQDVLTLGLVCLALSTDAFAAALARGSKQRQHHSGDALRVGAVFGLSEGLMFLAGWVLARSVSVYAEALDHWIALGLLSLIGLHMIREGFGNGAETDAPPPAPRRTSLRATLLTAIGTSVDAAAVGVAMALAGTSIWLAPAIGFTSFTISALGFSLGPLLGARFGHRAEIAGGLVLIAIGVSIFYSHITGG